MARDRHWPFCREHIVLSHEIASPWTFNPPESIVPAAIKWRVKTDRVKLVSAGSLTLSGLPLVGQLVSLMVGLNLMFSHVVLQRSVSWSVLWSVLGRR